ncbi:MAG TPA: hypothetical protein VFR67_13060 [Pilimelia sp.]|nr:hypothetical protein [Pilimelia sp.]
MNRVPTLLRRLSAFAAAFLLTSFALLVVASPAHAHHAEVSGAADCDKAKGQWVVTWTVKNSQDNKDATLVRVETAPDSPVEGIETGAVVPRNLPSHNNGELQGIQRVAGTATGATLTVGLDWPSHDEKGETYTGNVALKGTCAPDTAPPPPAPVPTAAGKSECDSLTVTVSNPKGGAPVKATIKYGTQSKSIRVAAGGSDKVTFPASTTEVATVTFPELDLEIDVAYAKPENCGGGGGLPVTGAAVGGSVAAAAVLLATGGGLVVATRRRRVRFTA